MKKLILIPIVALFSGCALQRTTSLNRETKQFESFTQVVWFQKASQDGLKVHSKTKGGTSSALAVSHEGTETQTEALAAVAKAAAEGAVKGMKP